MLHPALPNTGGNSSVYKCKKADMSTVKISVNWKDMDSGKDINEPKRKWKEIVEKSGVKVE